MKSFCFVGYIMGAGLIVAGSAHAGTPGVDADTILIAQSAAFSGTAGPLGESIRDGARLYFSEVNRAGGVHGRKIALLSLDDGYAPGRAVENTKLFLEDNSVFALFGYLGTQTSSAVVPVVSDAKIPFFGAFVGPEGLRNGVSQYIVNMRAEYSNPSYGEALAAEPTFFQLDGYIAAKTFVEALWRTGPDLTREKFIQTVESFRNVDLGDFRVTYVPNDEDGSSYGGLTVTINTEDDVIPALPAKTAARY